MTNLVLIGFVSISIIALSGCQKSVDLDSNSYDSSHTTNSTATIDQDADNVSTSIIVAPPGVTVIRVVNITGTETDQPTQSNDQTSDTNSSEPGTTTDSETNTGSDTSNPVVSTSNCEAFANPIDPFVRVELHYGLLSDAPYAIGELGSFDSLTVTEDAAQNATVLKLNSTAGLVSGQLITYEGITGNFHVAEVGDVLADHVTITSGGGLETEIKMGSNISNFYDNPTHPNINGYKAIADFGFRSAYSIITSNKTHALLGDSWFDVTEPSGAFTFALRLSERLPGSTIVNASIGGSTLCDLIERFDTDIAPANPQYVWINSSINDYFNDVPTPIFKTRMQFLISKVQAIGAEAIVFDSAPAVGTSFAGNDLTELSYGYAGAVLELLEETQQ